MPIDLDNLYRSSGFKFSDGKYEEEMTRLMRSRPQPPSLTWEHFHQFSFSNPRKHSFFEELRAYEEYIANGGGPGQAASDR